MKIEVDVVDDDSFGDRNSFVMPIAAKTGGNCKL